MFRLKKKRGATPMTPRHYRKRYGYDPRLDRARSKRRWFPHLVAVGLLSFHNGAVWITLATW